MELVVQVDELIRSVLCKSIIINEDNVMKCKYCKKNNNNSFLPIPIKKNKDVLLCRGWCCSYNCLITYLKKMKTEGNVNYNYSLNILWSCLPFFITNMYV